jgi:NTE family protein
MKVNAVFEGGGVRGVALAGAAAGAMELGMEFDQSVGTSAGALVSALLAAGYDSRELSESICRIQWPELLRPVLGTRVPLVGRHFALFTRRGLYDSRRLEEVWGELLAEHGVRTFGDLRPGSLGVVVTDLSHSRGVVFPEGLRAYGYEPAEFSVARVLRMSAAVPFVFTPVRLKNRINGDKVVMADGAMAANYPAGIVSKDRPVLGFRLVLDDIGHAAEHQRVRGPLTLARSVVTAGIRARYALPRPPEPGVSVVQVPVRNDLDFDMSNDEAQQVFDRARAAAKEQLPALMSEMAA